MNKQPLWKRPLFWICIPLMASVGGVVWYAAREGLAENEYRQKIAEMQAAGRPVSNADLDRLYNSNTSTEGSHEWNEAHYLLSVPGHKNESDRLPHIDIGPDTTEIDLATPWQYEKPAGELLAKYKPAIDQLHAAIERRSTPVWSPIDFDGLSTPLWNIQNVYRTAKLLELETEYSLRTGDTERAVRAIGDIFASADSIDLTFAMSLFSQNRIRLDGSAIIRRSLSAGNWTEEQIDSLAELTHQLTDLGKVWPAIIDNETAAIIATLESELPEPAGLPQTFELLRVSLPSSKLALLKSLEQLRGATANDLLAFQEDLVEFQDSTSAKNQPNGEFFSWYPQLVQSILNTENDRRLTQAAIAVKRFQLREGRWPEDLAELLVTDTSSESITSVDNKQFGYEVDAGAAYIWKHRTNDNNNVQSRLFPVPIPEERPKDFTKVERQWPSILPVVTIR